jgi:FkbM family methyltransferase
MKEHLKRFVNLFGYDIIDSRNSPRKNLLGLREYCFQTIIDVGANIGQFAQYISTVFPGVNIYSFEPLKDPYKILKEWVNNQSNENIKCFNVALGEREGDVTIFKDIADTTCSSMLESCTTKEIEPIQVTMTTLDKIVKKLSLPIIPELLIKLDVEGYEDKVIREGKETFRKARAAILEIQIDHILEGQAQFRDILQLMEDLGFRYAGNLSQWYAADGHVAYVNALFLKRQGLN